MIILISIVPTKYVRHYHQTDRVLVVGNCRYLMNLFLIPVQFLKFEYPSDSWLYAYCLMGYKLTINNIDVIRSVKKDYLYL